MHLDGLYGLASHSNLKLSDGSNKPTQVNFLTNPTQRGQTRDEHNC